MNSPLVLIEVTLGRALGGLEGPKVDVDVLEDGEYDCMGDAADVVRPARLGGVAGRGGALPS